MKSQEMPVPPPPKGGKEHTEKEYDHETKPGQESGKAARTTSSGGQVSTPAGSPTGSES